MAGRSAWPRLEHEAGLTLIEVMVTILLAAILSAGLFAIMTQQNRIYSGQLRQVDSQQNLIAAVEFLQSEVMRAGYPFTGCGGVLRVYDAASTSPANGVREENAIQVWDGKNLCGVSPGACQTGTPPDDPVHSDSFSIIYLDDATTDPTGVILAENYAGEATSKVSAIGSIVDQGLVVFWSPGKPNLGCVLLSVTADPTGQSGPEYTLSHGGSTGYNPPSGSTAIFAAGAFPKQAAVVVHLGTSLATTPPALRRRNFAIDRRRWSADLGRTPSRLIAWWTGQEASPDVIAENIEDLQIAWACDFSKAGQGEARPVGDGPDGALLEGDTPAHRGTDEWAGNVSASWPLPAPVADTPPTCRWPPTCAYPACQIAPISAVRITLVARNSSPEPGNRTGLRPGAENNPPGTLDDDLNVTGGVGTYQRSVRTIVVRPRNIRLQE